MYQPTKGAVKSYRDTVMEFGGLNQRVRGNENEFFDMRNMSSDCYPLLSPRKRRMTAYYTTNRITALCNKEAFIWTEIDGDTHRFYINGREIEYMSSSDIESKRQLVGMGAYVVMFPDGKYINLLDYDDCGTLGQKNTSRPLGADADGVIQHLILTPSTIDGKNISAKTIGTVAPSSPDNGEIWVDNSGEKTVYKKWDAATSQWVQMSTTYIKITRSEISKGINKWDTVSIRGLLSPVLKNNGTFDGEVSDRQAEQVAVLNNTDGAIVYNVAGEEKKNNFIVVAGILDKQCYIASGEVTVERKVPDMDFVVECNNRLWGCKYGDVDGKVVNEIYACRQGDFKNWYAYLGISTDSYAVSLGSEGHFTGAAVFNKCPVFFKQGCIHQIYGSMPSSYQLLTTNCEGVEKGQGDSVCLCNNALFYKGPTGFFAYTGSLPQKISRNLAVKRWGKVIGEGVGDKVYFACGDIEGEKTIYVYDTVYGLWHKEDERNVTAFSRDGHILYMLVREDGKNRIESVSDEVDISMIEGNTEFPLVEEDFEWYAESTDIGYSDTNLKYVQKITVRAKLSEGSEVAVYLSCDGSDFRRVGCEMYQEGVHTNEIAFTPERCEVYRYRIAGKGDVKIISVSKTVIQGSEKA